MNASSCSRLTYLLLVLVFPYEEVTIGPDAAFARRHHP
jgi:hypothetical protein